MTWPAWIDELKDRYLEEEASAFLVVGDIHDPRWEVEGEHLDAANVLVRLFARTRPLVGVLRTGRGGALRFPTFLEEKKFDELVDAALLLSGKALALSSREPLPALGRIWQALTTHGTDQAYMVVDVDEIVPAKRKRVDPIPGAPDLFDWPSHPTLRASNNVVVFLTTAEEKVRPELAAACAVIRLAGGGGPVALGAEALAALEHVASDVPEPQEGGPRMPTPAPEVVPVAGRARDDGMAALQEELATALVHALVQHPEEHRQAKIPVMEAVAVVWARRGVVPSGLVFRLDDEGAVVVDGGDEVLAMWRSDIALDAAAGMILKSLPSGFSEQAPPDLDPTGLRALAKRVAKRLG